MEQAKTNEVKSVGRELPPTLADKEAMVNIGGRIAAVLIQKNGINHFYRNQDSSTKVVYEARVKEIAQLARALVTELKNG